MRSRVVRVVLFLLVALAFGAAAYNISTIERRQAAVRVAARAFEDDVRQADATLTELKAARYAYVAPGQGTDFWMEKATALTGSLGSRLKKLELDAASANARDAAAAAAQLLETSRQAEANVRSYLREQQTPIASDLIFGDLRQSQEAIAARLASARDEERASREATIEAGRRMELATAAGAALFALIVLLVLLPAGAPPESSVGVAAAGEARTHFIAPPPTTVKPARAPSPLPELLPQAARLCTDFARMKETSELPTLLERLASLLDASGIIVWIAEPASGELRPAAAHGYAPNALTHIRAISNEADNATASAFRQCAVQVVEGDGTANGAIAVPLVTPDGCVGVMAAEVRRGGERQGHTQAIASIVAAQMATLVAPQEAPGV